MFDSEIATSLIGAVTGGPGPVFLLLLALCLDAAIGDWTARLLPWPGWPVRQLCEWADRRLNRPDRSPTTRLVRGGLLVLVLIGMAILIGMVCQYIADQPRGWPLALIVLLASLRWRSHWSKVGMVASALEKGGLERARDTLAPLTRRNTLTLDDHGVARTALESLAGAMVRSLVAPAIAFVTFGLPGLLAWVVVATSATTIGDGGFRHERFGKLASQLDQILCLIPARLTALLVAVASPFMGGRFVDALQTPWRDAHKAPSRNVGWPVAAFAGALGLALGGPHRDGGVMISEPWIGDGRARAVAADVQRGLALGAIATLIVIGVTALTLVVTSAL